MMAVVSLGIAAMVAAILGHIWMMWGSVIGLALTGISLSCWYPLTYELFLRKRRAMESDPARYTAIRKEDFHPRYSSLRHLIAAHDEKSGMLHSFSDPRNKRIDNYLELDNEQDRIMFRLSL